MVINRDMAGGIAAAIIGAVYLYYASLIRVSALDDTFGPGGMPRVYGWLMLVLGIMIAAGGLTKSIRQKSGGSEKGEWAGQGNRIMWAAGMLAIGAAYLLLVPYAGYAITIGLLLAATAMYQGAKRDWRTAMVAIGGASILWAIFVLVLHVSMPPGLLKLF